MTSTTIRRMRTALTALALTAATAGTAVAVAGPASATASTCTPTASITVNHKTTKQTIRFGDNILVEASVAPNCTGGSFNPDTPLYGTLKIQRTTNGTSWTTVATGDTPGYVGVNGTKLASRLSGFRAVYTGGTDPTYGDTYTDATSSMQLVHVFRASKEVRSRCGHRGCTDTWKFSPIASIKGMKVQIQRMSGGRWRNVTKVRVSSKGTITHTFPIGVNRLLLPVGRGFDGSYVKWKITRYTATAAREAARR